MWMLSNKSKQLYFSVYNMYIYLYIWPCLLNTCSGSPPCLVVLCTDCTLLISIPTHQAAHNDEEGQSSQIAWRSSLITAETFILEHQHCNNNTNNDYFCQSNLNLIKNILSCSECCLLAGQLFPHPPGFPECFATFPLITYLVGGQSDERASFAANLQAPLKVRAGNARFKEAWVACWKLFMEMSGWRVAGQDTQVVSNNTGTPQTVRQVWHSGRREVVPVIVSR